MISVFLTLLELTRMQARSCSMTPTYGEMSLVPCLVQTTQTEIAGTNGVAAVLKVTSLVALLGAMFP